MAFSSGEISSTYIDFVVSGLVDTAVKTAETGYMQRRLVKVRKYLLLALDVELLQARVQLTSTGLQSWWMPGNIAFTQWFKLDIGLYRMNLVSLPFNDYYHGHSVYSSHILPKLATLAQPSPLLPQKPFFGVPLP